MIVNIEALQQLKRVIRDIPRIRFNVAFWSTPDTTCPVNAACCDPWFIMRGWHRNAFKTPTMTTDDGRPAPEGFHMVSKFVGVSEEQINTLFCPNSYQKPGTKSVYQDNDSVAEVLAKSSFVTPEMVLARIDALIESERSKLRRFDDLLCEREPA